MLNIHIQTCVTKLMIIIMYYLRIHMYVYKYLRNIIISLITKVYIYTIHLRYETYEDIIILRVF